MSGLVLLVLLPPDTALALPTIPCTQASFSAGETVPCVVARLAEDMGPAAPKGVYFWFALLGECVLVVLVEITGDETMVLEMVLALPGVVTVVPKWWDDVGRSGDITDTERPLLEVVDMVVGLTIV